MMNPVSTSLAETNSQTSFECTEPQEMTSEEEILRSLRSLNKYYRGFRNEFEVTLRKSILSFLSLESALAQIKGLQEVHFSNVASGEARSTEEVEHGDGSDSSNTPDDTRQGVVNQIDIVVSVQSDLNPLENEIRMNQNLLAEMNDPIHMLKVNITRVQRELKMRLQSYFRNINDDREKHRQKTAKLEEKLFQAITKINSLEEMNVELEQKLKNKNDKEEQELELEFSAQQTNLAADHVEIVTDSGIDRSTNVSDTNNETDFNRDARQHSQNLQTNAATSQQNSTLVGKKNFGFISPKQKLLDTYKHLLAALKSNEELGTKLRRYKEINKDQKRRIAELEESRINDHRETNAMVDLVEAYEEELKLKDNQLKCQQETLTNIQSKLKSAENQLNQLRCISTVEEDSRVQVLRDKQTDEVSQSTSLEDISEESPQTRQPQNSSTLLNMNDISDNESKIFLQNSLDVNQSNEHNQADVDGTDTNVAPQVVFDQETHDLTIFQRKTEEMQNRIIDLEENSSKLQQMLADAKEANLIQRNYFLDIEQKNDKTIDIMYRLNEKLKEELEQKNILLDTQKKDIADIQEKLESAEKKLTASTDIYTQTDQSVQYPEDRIEEVEFEAAKLNADLERLKQKCALKAQWIDRSKKHLNDHEMINLITELRKVHEFLITVRTDQSNTKKTFQILRSEIHHLRNDKLMREQKLDYIQTNVINQMSLQHVTDTDDSTQSTSHNSSRSVSPREYEQETVQSTSELSRDANFSMSGASTSKYHDPQLTGMFNKETTSCGSSIDVVNRFLYYEQAAQNNEEESESMFGGSQQTLLSPSEGYGEPSSAASRSTGFRASIRRLFRMRENSREIIENGNIAVHTFTDLYSSQNNNSYYKRAMLLEKMRSGAPFTSWDGPTLGFWLEQWVGMPPCYISICKANVKSGQIMTTITDQQIRNELLITNPLHKLKLKVAIREMLSLTIHPCAATITRATLAFRELNHRWIGNNWLPSLGLSKYRNRFMDCLVDARMLEHLTVEHLRDQLKMKSGFHRASLCFGLICLKIFNYDHCLLRERRKMCENTVSDVLVWTNTRVIKWIVSIGLGEWAQNLKGSGLHGALIALDRGFDASNMASLLKIPNQNVEERRTLELHFNNLIQNMTERF